MECSRRDFLKQAGRKGPLQLLSGLAQLGLVPFMKPADMGSPEDAGRELGRRLQAQPSPLLANLANKAKASEARTPEVHGSGPAQA